MAGSSRLSDEAVCARYLDSPYAQLFCGETFFQHALPLDRSSLTRWRQRIGAERLELLLTESLAAARCSGAVEDKHLQRVTIDTTVQPKAVTHPTDSKLLHRGIEILARLARRHGIRLRQSYLRVARRARREAARLIHAGRRRQAERQVRQLRTWLGRLFRDIGRKIAGRAAMQTALAGPLGLVARTRPMAGPAPAMPQCWRQAMQMARATTTSTASPTSRMTWTAQSTQRPSNAGPWRGWCGSCCCR